MHCFWKKMAGLGLALLGTLAGQTVRAGLVIESDARVLHNGVEVVADPQSGPPPDGVSSLADGAKGASATAQTHFSGTLFARSTIETSGGDGGVGAAGAFDPITQLESWSTSFFRQTFVASAGGPLQLGFHVTPSTLSIIDNSGAFTAADPLIAEVSAEIRFALGSGPLTAADAVYGIDATLKAAGTTEVGFQTSFFNPTGAALPDYHSLGPSGDTIHLYRAAAFDSSLDLGSISVGQEFTLEYVIKTRAYAPGATTGNSASVFAQFGDPFSLDFGPYVPVLQTSVPEPSTLTLLATAGVGLLVMRRRRR